MMQGVELVSTPLFIIKVLKNDNGTGFLWLSGFLWV